MKAFMVAGTQSGVGKTTITVALLAALRARGLRVAPFKAGPDYIDPTHHEAAAGVPSRNLDTWMLPPETVVQSFRRAAGRADVAVVEGVMGLFDGKSGEDESGSSAHLAKLLGIPVILVIDARAMARSAGAMVLGYRTFDPAVRVAGVIVNQLASEGHYATTRSAITRQGGVAVLGGIYRDQTLHLPERHLGLVPTQEATPAAFLAEAAALAERSIDIDRLMAVAADIEPHPAGEAARAAAVPRVPIAVARDRAFTFYYEDSLELLEDAGAEILPFSPLADRGLPRGSRGVYIGGGFPEVYAQALAENSEMHAALREAHGRGVPIYAECGGHMYLGRTLTDGDGVVHRMAGLTPVTSAMAGTRLTLGYRTARALRDGAMFARGETIRGHEFHLSASPAAPAEAACWEFTEPALGPAGYSEGSLWSSYLHVHLGAAPGAAARFINSCERVQQR